MRFIAPILIVLAVVSYLALNGFFHGNEGLLPETSNAPGDGRTELVYTFRSVEPGYKKVIVSGNANIENTPETSPDHNNPPDNLYLLYSWKDGNNTRVISQSPPPANTDFNILYYASENREGDTKQQVKDGIPDYDSTPGSFMENPMKVYTPSGFKELLEYSRGIGEKVEVRDQELKELMEQL